MKKHSFKKSGTNFYKNGAGGGSKAIYKLYKKTDVLEKDVVPKGGMGSAGIQIDTKLSKKK